MPRIPGVNHVRAIRALEKAGFRIRRQGKHVMMDDGITTLIIPRITQLSQVLWEVSSATPV
jgi:predicted RNA binding protein YcfA (HicA-like mRNA interferase family)